MKRRPAVLWVGKANPDGGCQEAVAVDVLLRRSYLLSILGRWDEAEGSLMTCRSLSGIEGREEFDCKVMLVLAGILINQGRLGEADEILVECESAGPEMDAESRMDLGNLRGKMAMYRGDLDASKKEFSCVLESAEKEGSQMHWARAALNLGNISVMQGDMGGAESFYRDSLETAERLGDASGVGMALGGLGILAAERGDSREALDLFKRDLEIGMRLGQTQTVAQTHGNIGLLLVSAEKFAEAAESYRRQLEITRGMGDAQGTFNALYCLAKCMRGMGRLAEAEELFRKAVSHGMEWSMATDSAGAQLELAEMLAESGRPGEAGTALEELLRLGDLIKDPEIPAKARLLLGRLAASGGGELS